MVSNRLKEDKEPHFSAVLFLYRNIIISSEIINWGYVRLRHRAVILNTHPVILNTPPVILNEVKNPPSFPVILSAAKNPLILTPHYVILNAKREESPQCHCTPSPLLSLRAVTDGAAISYKLSHMSF